MFDRRAVLLTALLMLLALPAFAQSRSERFDPVDVYLRTARIAMASKPPEYKRAMHNLEIARRHYPENFAVHFLLGTIWAEKDEIDSMVAEYALAEKYATEKQWKKSARDLHKVYEQKWLDRFNRAAQLFGQADSMSEATDVITDAQKADSLRGVIDQIRNLTKEALNHCIILLPNDFRGYSVRGLIHQRQGTVDSSLSDFIKAEALLHRYELNDSTTDWYDTTLFFQGPNGEKTEAFKAYRKAYKKLSDEKRTRYRNLMISLGAAYYDAQDWVRCIMINRRFHGLFPKDISAIVTLADVFSKVGNEDEAFKWQESVVRENPNSKDTWYNMGIFFYNKAIRLQDSIAKYDRALDDKADDTVAQKGFEINSLGSAANFIQAVPRFRRVVEIDPDDEETVRLIAVSVFSTASLIADLKTRLGAETAEETVTAIWKKAASELGLERDDTEQRDMVLWLAAKTDLNDAAALFPDDNSLCRMMKVALARLGDIEGLREWVKKCP